jgi:hypothetical protein
MESDGTISYAITWRLPDGAEERESEPSFRTKRQRDVGEIVNLPTGPDGKGRTGKGYLWRVVAVEEDAQRLVLAYERPHPEMMEEISSD